ncbi:hypothetical protein HMPREF0058_0746 [Actinomyces urogenitalis DSM 15434]|jgi:HK97 family phage major capsid protein|uniref:Phage capsid-like C-terminal domain-containing protein n=3 Tax=root TaxID=1 RepID=C0W4F2_9ACTO|nr:phage major capsid protein [Actinomyces urogenitalis]EEH66380.1 hypothetical protein HMPREF0058_0746 [Actinomyces urogenitalis DSM 15434]
MAIGTNAMTVDSLDNPAGTLPKEIVGEIWKGVQHTSVVQRVAGTTLVPITGGITYMQTGELVAGIVGEGEDKPITSGKTTAKAFKPVKAAAIAYWSKEARQANPGGYLDNLVEDLTSAVARAIDLAVIHGKDARTGNAIAGVEYLAQSTNAVELGTNTKTKGGLNADLLDGYDKLAAKDFNLTGFIADPRLRSKLLRATDTQGRPIYQASVSLRDAVDSVLGLPIAYGRGAVAGKIGASTDTGIRAIGGDFSTNLRLGFVENITFKRTDTATIVDGGKTVNLWQQNMEAILVEAQFGWVLRDKDAFVLYKDAVADTEATAA